VIDPGGHLASELGDRDGITYLRVGAPRR
jgi:hypothetical protein